MIETPDPACESRDAKKPDHAEELIALLNWLQLAMATSTDIVQLLQLELRLAIADLKRLFVLALLFLPIVLLAWISSSVLLAWLAYQLNASITQGLMAFCMLQFLALVGIVLAWRFYRRSLSIPLTRQHIRRLIGSDNSDT